MGLESLKNESLCLEIQAGGKNVDLCLAQLLRNNAEEFAQWAKEAVAEALKKEAAMSPDELMARLCVASGGQQRHISQRRIQIL